MHGGTLLPPAPPCAPAFPPRLLCRTVAPSPCSLYETWIISEYCDRGSLAEAVAPGSRLRPAGPDPVQHEVWTLLCGLDVALGLDYLHQATIVHGDLKVSTSEGARHVVRSGAGAAGGVALQAP